MELENGVSEEEKEVVVKRMKDNVKSEAEGASGHRLAVPEEFVVSGYSIFDYEICMFECGTLHSKSKESVHWRICFGEVSGPKWLNLHYSAVACFSSTTYLLCVILWSHVL